MQPEVIPVFIRQIVMTRLHPIRDLAVLALIGALAFLLQTPLCAPEICPMREARMSGACKPLGMDCCQTAGERTSPASIVEAPLLAPTVVSEPILCPAPEPGSPEPSAAPSILQGVSLHTLFGVFLI